MKVIVIPPIQRYHQIQAVSPRVPLTDTPVPCPEAWTDYRSVDHFSIQQLSEGVVEGFVVILKTGAKCRGASDNNNALFGLFILPDVAASKPRC